MATGGLALLGVAALILLAVPPPQRADRYSVYDGDTLEMVPGTCLLAHFHFPCFAQRLRLLGVDALERHQNCRDAEGRLWPCGDVATERLKELVAHPDFHCEVNEQFVDRHAREFALCLSDGKDVGAILVSEGLAFAYGRRTRYVTIESEAKREHRGAWAGTFVRPQFYRAGARDYFGQP
ncbi:MAG TPA: thermonuclease family protein [Stellaceae bacterium]|nr:thermonuclease family protein [Stellaceae bacterium]